MARMPGADFIGPTPNETDGGQEEVRGLVLHIQQGTEAGSEAWFKNPASEASAHFLNPKSGGLRQLIDTSNRAWAQAAGNRYWVSVENEGFVPDALTASQLENAARLLAWLHNEYSVPLQSADDPNGHGLGWHGMGGAAWGGHFDCPGTAIKAQRPQIIARAQQIVGGSPTPAPAPSPSGVARYQVVINGLHYGYGAHGDHITAVGQALVRRGFGRHYQVGPGPTWSDADTENYSDYQRSLGYAGTEPHQDADGVPGPTTLKELLGTLPTAPASVPRVSLAHVRSAAQTDPRAAQGHQTHAADVRVVEAALKAEGLLATSYAGDGSWGTKTLTAYAAWQHRAGVGGPYDGIPGIKSLTLLGAKHHFHVTA